MVLWSCGEWGAIKVVRDTHALLKPTMMLTINNRECENTQQQKLHAAIFNVEFTVRCFKCLRVRESEKKWTLGRKVSLVIDWAGRQDMGTTLTLAVQIFSSFLAMFSSLSFSDVSLLRIKRMAAR